MKSVGLNVASDTFFSLGYTGLNKGCVLVFADDPFCHSSQSEEDVLMGMEAIETLRYIEFLKPSGTIILNNYLWYPVQSTFERVKNPETSYVSFEVILAQLKKVTTNIHVINALELANKAGNPLISNVVLLGALTKVK